MRHLGHAEVGVVMATKVTNKVEQTPQQLLDTIRLLKREIGKIPQHEAEARHVLLGSLLRLFETQADWEELQRGYPNVESLRYFGDAPPLSPEDLKVLKAARDLYDQVEAELGAKSNKALSA